MTGVTGATGVSDVTGGGDVSGESGVKLQADPEGRIHLIDPLLCAAEAVPTQYTAHEVPDYGASIQIYRTAQGYVAVVWEYRTSADTGHYYTVPAEFPATRVSTLDDLGRAMVEHRVARGLGLPRHWARALDTAVAVEAREARGGSAAD